MNNILSPLDNASITRPKVPAALAAKARTAACTPRLHAGGRIEAIGAALERAATVRAAPSHGRWLITLPNSRRRATVEFGQDWLTFEVSLPRRGGPLDHGSLGTLLRRNARMSGCLRIIGNCLEQQRHLVCEIPTDLLPFDSDADIDALITAIIEDLHVHLGKQRGTLDRPALRLPARDELTAMLEEAGWPAQNDDGERVEVPLDVAGDYVVASVERTDGPVRLVMPVLEYEMQSATRDSRRAVTALLWLATSGVRMARARRVRRALSIEVCLPPVPVTGTGLAHGCAALSTAAQRMLAESRLLIADEQLARTYLTQLGLAVSQ